MVNIPNKEKKIFKTCVTFEHENFITNKKHAYSRVYTTHFSVDDIPYKAARGMFEKIENARLNPYLEFSSVTSITPIESKISAVDDPLDYCD